jgi:hypothetical protein
MRPVLLGCASGVVLWLLALFCAGGGHGTYLPIAVFGAPLSLIPGIALVSPLIVWSLSGVAVARRWRPALAVLVLSHASGVAAAMLLGTPFENSDDQWTYLANAIRQIGVAIVAAFVLYAFAIAAMVYLASRGSSSPPSAATG